MPGTSDRQFRQVRVFLCVWLAVAATTLAWYYGGLRVPSENSDFFQLWGAARAILAGKHPYAVVGPGLEYEWRVPLAYPPPALVLALPFTLLSLRLADALFVGFGTLALAWVLTRKRVDNPQLLVFASATFLFALQRSQWSPILIAATFFAPLAPLFVCKPTVALALLAAYPRVRTILVTAITGIASIALLPWTWWRGWLDVLPQVGGYMTPLVMRFSIGGPLILLGLLRWRRPEARLLVALACIPLTPLPYEALPLFLVTTTIWESATLVVLSIVVVVLMKMHGGFAGLSDYLDTYARVMFWGLYLPCLGVVLARPNISPTAAPRIIDVRGLRAAQTVERPRSETDNAK